MVRSKDGKSLNVSALQLVGGTMMSSRIDVVAGKVSVVTLNGLRCSRNCENDELDIKCRMTGMWASKSAK